MSTLPGGATRCGGIHGCSPEESGGRDGFAGCTRIIDFDHCKRSLTAADRDIEGSRSRDIAIAVQRTASLSARSRLPEVLLELVLEVLDRRLLLVEDLAELALGHLLT